MKKHGNILQEDGMDGIIPGNKLKDHPNVLQEAGNKSKDDESNLKILGEEMTFVGFFRNFEPFLIQIEIHA